MEEVKSSAESVPPPPSVTTNAGAVNAEDIAGWVAYTSEVSLQSRVVGKCNTCAGLFATKEAYRAHFRFHTTTDHIIHVMCP